MSCPLLWGTESWKSFLCKWHGFIVRNQEWPHYCQKKLARDELLQPPIVTVGRCPPTSSWLLFNNLWIAFTHVVTEGYIFVLSRVRDSPGGDTCLTLGVCGCSVRISLMPSWVICKMYFEKVHSWIKITTDFTHKRDHSVFIYFFCRVNGARSVRSGLGWQIHYH